MGYQILWRTAELFISSSPNFAAFLKIVRILFLEFLTRKQEGEQFCPIVWRTDELSHLPLRDRERGVIVIFKTVQIETCP